MTSSGTASDQDAVICETEIAAPPSRVFEALSTAEQLKVWFSDSSCPVKSWRMDARKGGRWFMGTAARAKPLNGVSEFRAGGEVLEIEAPQRLVYTWHANWHDDPSLATLVKYELHAAATGTKVKVTHSGLAGESLARADYNSGWPGVLEMLKKFAQK